MDIDPTVGTHVGGYAIEGLLGRGGMGVIYLARQRSPDRRVALKLIDPALADDDSFRQRFLRESAAAAAIDHPHILPVYDAGEIDGVLFIAMRVVDGRDLRQILRTGDRLELDRVLVIVAQVGAALDAAHERGLVHRDVKPGNILVTPGSDGEEDFCYLTDFGVSTWATSTAATVTSSGQMVGSVNYAAPEQIEGKRVEGRADVYSLGCVLYECLTGRAPFAGRGPAGTLHAHLHEDPAPPSSLRPDLPSGVDAVVARALRKDPSERYATCRELAADLRAALAGRTPLAATEADRTVERSTLAPPVRARRRWRWAAVAAVVALVATGAGLAIARDVWAPSSTGNGSPTPRPERIRSGVGVTATQTRPSGTDAAGNPVTYLPSNVIDGKLETAWEAPGNGRGDRLTLIFDNPIDVVRIGLIPGYAKTDPLTGANRFQQNRIVKEVRYLIPGLPPTTQTFRLRPIPQFVHIGVLTSRITIEIVDTTEPGGLDYTAISEVYVYGYAQ